MKRIIISTWAFLFALTLLAANSHAGQTVSCKVITVKATKDKVQIDKELQKYADILAQEPFKQFTSFKMVSQKKYALTLNDPHSLRLPSELKGTLEYVGKQDSKLKLKLKVKRPGKSGVTLRGIADGGVPFIAGGFKKKNGRWLFIVACDE